MDESISVRPVPDYASAYDAWKAEAQRTVDNAHLRAISIAPICTGC